ncbi:hypothetical protein DPMN_006040 [Dreissena polymorpha]|uniref:Uncharacterized protein n=1 Tax=Dreissena polymorpha TaxID=45954 RepID=A0A9D4MUH4_DREPO|nr:hypothetical protein DPMN_006040 [Dreissena polymorpha]
MPDPDAMHALRRESAQLFKHQPLPRGCTSILAFDPDSKSYQRTEQRSVPDSQFDNYVIMLTSYSCYFNEISKFTFVQM